MPIIQAAATYPSYAAISPNPPSDDIGVSKQRAVPPWMHFGTPVSAMAEATTGRRAPASINIRLTMPRFSLIPPETG